MTELTEQQKAQMEYTRRFANKEYKMPEALKDASCFDVLMMPEYVQNIERLIAEQSSSRDAYLEAVKDLEKKGKFVPRENRPVIDRVRELGLLDNTGDFVVEYANVIARKSNFPREVREYIQQLGALAAKLTIHQLVREADPEMSELYRKANETTKN